MGSIWASRQRQSKMQGTLSEDRLNVLEGLQFDSGDVVEITDKWEEQFDELLDSIMSEKSNGDAYLGAYSWDMIGYKSKVGLALWVTLQRTYHAYGMLPPNARHRLEFIGLPLNFPNPW